MDQILGYLKKFDWEPESVSTDENEQITIVLFANIDIKDIEIKIRFSESGLWLYFSSLFLSKVENNQVNVYEELLNLNYKTTLTKFGISDEKNIYALIELPLIELDFSEFSSALKRLVNDINKYIIPCVELIRGDKDYTQF